MPLRPSVHAPRRNLARTVSAWSSRVWAVATAATSPRPSVAGTSGNADGALPLQWSRRWPLLRPRNHPRLVEGKAKLGSECAAKARSPSPLRRVGRGAGGARATPGPLLAPLRQRAHQTTESAPPERPTAQAQARLEQRCVDGERRGRHGAHPKIIMPPVRLLAQHDALNARGAAVIGSQATSAAQILGCLAASNLLGIPVRNLRSTNSFSTPITLS